jgi:hypothetical protein
MPEQGRRVVVVDASAGGVEALTSLARATNEELETMNEEQQSTNEAPMDGGDRVSGLIVFMEPTE